MNASLHAVALGLVLAATGPAAAYSVDCDRPESGEHTRFVVPIPLTAPPFRQVPQSRLHVAKVPGSDAMYDIDAQLVTLGALAVAVGAAAGVDVRVADDVAQVPVTVIGSSFTLPDIAALIAALDPPATLFGGGAYRARIVDGTAALHVSRGKRCRPLHHQLGTPVPAPLRDGLPIAVRVVSDSAQLAIAADGIAWVSGDRELHDVIRRLVDQDAVAASAPLHCRRPEEPWQPAAIREDPGAADVRIVSERAAGAAVLDARFRVVAHDARADVLARALAAAWGGRVVARPDVAGARVSLVAGDVSYAELVTLLREAGIALSAATYAQRTTAFLGNARIPPATTAHVLEFAHADDALTGALSICPRLRAGEELVLLGRKAVLRAPSSRVDALRARAGVPRKRDGADP